MMKAIRWILGKIILAVDAITAPTPMARSVEAQQKLDEATAKLKLYQYHACPFCVKVRREIRRLNLKIELIDAKEPAAEKRLMENGGKRQVPCLYIINPDNSTTWLYESDAIIIFLQTLAKEAV